ncbi:Rho GTPase-activating protein 1 [Termitomyces sp. J132]|nr:Rho GTPase-activating protein 1 [Termitomyces sp. J132]
MPPFNLKQRLAALSISPSSPSPSNGQEPRSPFSALKKKTQAFTPPWAKRPQQESTLMLGESGAVQEAMDRMIFQAGVDFETKPMVVVNASALPDPREVSYDLLLSCILSYFDLYVESDYTVVFFAAGGRHAPGWNWVWKAYRNLSRKYRKNLKQLYIVHSSFFSKMLFSLAGAIISPKFFRKLVYIDTLSELATMVPITQIDIPRAVYQENLKFEDSITMPTPMRSNIFGVSLEELMGYGGEKGGLPRVVKDSIQYLRENGLLEDGLFRRSPSSAMLRAAQDAYDRGNVVSLKSFGDAHLAAVLLKKYLRDLPEPIFPEALYPLIRRCPLPTSDSSDVASVTYIRSVVLSAILPCAYILLSQVLHLMHEVSLRAASNRMDAQNLAIVLCPNLLKGSNPMRDVMMCSVANAAFTSPSSSPDPSSSPSATLGVVIKICIERYYEVFDEVLDRSEAVPPSRSYQDSDRSEASASPTPGHDDESIDDAMLVMPIGPSGSRTGLSSAWVATNGNGGFKPQHRSNLSHESVRSVQEGRGQSGSIGGGGNNNVYLSASRSKSMMNIENGTGTVGGRRGSITLGRGTMKKSSGAGVEAIGVTAEGFFSPPSNVLSVPPKEGNGLEPSRDA